VARARNIKPGFFTNDILGELDPLARLLFAGLWCHADRSGRLEDRPKRLKAEILPYDECDVNGLIQCLHDAGMVLRYVVDGKNYIQIVKFEKHQNPHVKEAVSQIPAPDEHSASQEKHEASHADSLLLIPDSLKPIKASPAGEFVRFWDAWPKHDRKASKGKCFDVWRKKKLDPLTDQIIAHVEALKLTDQWRGGYIPAPLVYLNREEWDGAEVGQQQRIQVDA
jgi:hypothetical protein